MYEVSIIDLLSVIKERRSIHNFKQEVVPKRNLAEIFTYGSWAPNHYMKEPWKIKLYQEKGKEAFVQSIMASYQRIGLLKTSDDQKTLRMIESMTKFLLNIPHHALVYFPKEADLVRYEEDYAAVCAFIQNAQLAAWTYGVGMLWTITPYMHDPEFMKDIGLDSKEMKIAAIMQIDYPKKAPRNKERTPIEEKIEFISE